MVVASVLRLFNSTAGWSPRSLIYLSTYLAGQRVPKSSASGVRTLHPPTRITTTSGSCRLPDDG